MCMCTPLYSIVVLGTAFQGGEMINTRDGNSILHQHRAVSLLALLKKA